MQDKINNKLIVALDVENCRQARKLINLLYPTVNIFKVGSQLFTACGPKIIKILQDKRAKVFLDLKFHDIPNTVAGAVTSAVALRVDMFTVHIQGGLEMLKAAKKARDAAAKKLQIKPPKILGVTVLTSQCAPGLKQRILQFALLAKRAGLDGVVASCDEASILRRKFGKGFVIITPGIRLIHYEADDQRRIATPKEAILSGADYIVVGRPIVEAKRPLGVAKYILNQMKGSIYGRRD